MFPGSTQSYLDDTQTLFVSCCLPGADTDSPLDLFVINNLKIFKVKKGKDRPFILVLITPFFWTLQNKSSNSNRLNYPGGVWM